MELQSISPIVQFIILFVFGGGLIGILTLLWKISRRNFDIDVIQTAISLLGEKIVKIEDRIENEDDETSENFKSSQERIVDIEKELIEIKTNQKNLLYSIDSQNFQILDLIDRLEKNHESFIKTQIKVNDKLELAINAIKDSLINLSKN